MNRPTRFDQNIPLDYCGLILHGNYSAELKTCVADHIRRYRNFEKMGVPALLYIAGWQARRKKIWYEYAGRQLVALLDCEPAEAAEVLRNSVIDRRIYKCLEQGEIQEETTSGEEVCAAWKALRRESKMSGTIEAVYKLSLPQGGTIWLKDRARTEAHAQDGICLSLGFMTVISKEMAAEDELKAHRDSLEVTVLERTAELIKLNRQLRQEIVERKQAEERLQVSCEKLQQNLGEIIAAMSLTVEERDPYTAGHQKRTTRLAIALAKEMSLSENEIRGIEMAGMVHDIGKISVPAEILSKPGALNEPEMQLIQRHPQVACDILKKIDFQWPVDQIVLQHHEKMDRSGYPQGLSGEEILLAARILCVADVVESMASHRPYRPALGLQSALEEISNNRGTLYDPEVVDACLKTIDREEFLESIESQWESIFN